MTEPLLTRYDAPGRPDAADPDAARRQAALGPAGRRPQRLLAPRRRGCSARSPPGPTRRARACGWCATASAAGTAAPTASPTPAGPSTGCAPSTGTSPSCCSATRWAPGWPSTSPTTRRWSAWSGSRRGGRRRTPSHTLAGRSLVAAHGRRDRITSYAETRRYVERARDVAADATLHDMGALGHYMLTGVDRWNDVALDRAALLAPLAPPGSWDDWSVDPPRSSPHGADRPRGGRRRRRRGAAPAAPSRTTPRPGRRPA